MTPPDVRRTERVAAVIPTKNAMPLLETCLDSVSWCDEIVVVDMHSSDGTVELCRRYPQCRVAQREGYIFENFNVGVETATTEWIIRLDADEALTPALVAELRGFLAAPDPSVAGYRAPVELYFFGQRLRGGFATSVREIMFRRGAARYPVRSEHEPMVTTGTWRECRHPYVHRTNPTVGDLIRKIDFYSDRDAERHPQPYRPSAARGLYVAIRAFLRFYVRYGCWKDGYAGFIVSWSTAFGMLVNDAKVWERWKPRGGSG